MTPQTSLESEFGDGIYLFDLKLPQMAELQQKTGCGIFKLYGRVMKGRFIVGEAIIAPPTEGEAFDTDLYETIRLALIGGGRGSVDGVEVEVTPLTARTLVERYCHGRPLKESWALAAAILGARIEGYTPPKKAAPAPKPAAKRKRASTSPKS